jgi:hypothetical protein
LRIKNFPAFLAVDVGNTVFTSSGSTLTPQRLTLGSVALVKNPGGRSEIGRIVKIDPPEFDPESLLWVITEHE